MNELEKIMENNREMFMEQEPSNGHLERFEKRLRKQNRKNKTIILITRVSKIAAVGILIIMSSMWAYNEFLQPGSIKLSDISSDYKDVEFYYTMQVNSKIEQISNCVITDSTNYEETMTKELTQLDSVYKQLQKDLNTYPGDEKIIHSMILIYQTKLQVVSNILKQLKDFQKLNNTQTNKQNHYESIEL